YDVETWMEFRRVLFRSRLRNVSTSVPPNILGHSRTVFREWCVSGQADDLRAVDEPGTEADLQGQSAAEFGLFAQQSFGGQGNRRRRGVAVVGDVPGDDDGVRQLQLLGQFVDDAHIGLVRDEGGEVTGFDPRGGQSL